MTARRVFYRSPGAAAPALRAIALFGKSESKPRENEDA